MISLWLIGWGIAAVYFAGVWALGERLRNHGFLDVAWSYGVAVLAPFYAWHSSGEPLRKWIFVGLGAAWSLRLGTYVLLRVLRHHPREDPRYERLREQWKGPARFFLFFEIQALVAAIFSVPFLAVCFDRTAEASPLFWAGAAVVVLSIAGESLADWQMKRFQREETDRGKVCQRGLWAYSRHPNYFFEFLAWVGFALAAWPSPHGWLGLACPALILFFLLRVTGIPLTEEFSLRSKGDAYRAYQRTTSPFVPWFRRPLGKDAAAAPPAGDVQA